MRKWHIDSPDPETVAVLLYPQFSNHCLANAIEPLRAANELLLREVYRWDFVTLDGEAVRSSSGLPILPDGRLADHPGGAYLFVTSSYGARAHASPATNRALRAARDRFRTVAGLDTGSWLMARAGLLDGRRATIHWDELTAFSEMFGAVEAVSERFVIDGDTITCGGAMAAFDLVLDLIRRTHGEALRLGVAAFFMHPNAERPREPVYRRKGSDLVERCISQMEANLETPLRIGELAGRLGVSSRQLGRTFRVELGATPQTVYRRLRLMSARRYAEQSGYSVTEIALRCGYQNAAAMTRAFVQEFGAPPTVFRSRGGTGQ